MLAAWAGLASPAAAQTRTLLAPSAQGTVRALVIGIDDYDATPNLKGAVADACHGGGLTRNVDPRAGELSYRTAGEITDLLDELAPIAMEADSLRDPSVFERVTFLAAADNKTKAPELEIPGITGLRGVLS